MRVLPIMLASLLAGCSTLHFDNGTKISTEVAKEQWHHTALFAFVELSSPVELDRACQSSNWSSVKTEVSFLNGLAGGLVNSLSIVPVWSPQTATVTCSPLVNPKP